jgi:hypothetical protein
VPVGQLVQLEGELLPVQVAQEGSQGKQVTAVGVPKVPAGQFYQMTQAAGALGEVKM